MWRGEAALVNIEKFVECGTCSVVVDAAAASR